ncbi:AmpR family transcriptional activator [Proteus hauseri ATCC 700826]|uniref:AmpR family transcriptional activator n=1 Tax=Proteus hauseri ATCC 700826 TaxID=1354271 RepID=A0AAJ3HSX2_PROHU|nr:LysR family transcriptional regulator [Proteus hauseri]OAT46643.1 AmpR family transcriptional activator [Proteus hauseri ATCC 700826]
MRTHLPLNALRAFEASARHLNFTKAALELYVTQGAVSQQVRMLENRLGVVLFRRLPRGLEMTDDAQILFSVLTNAFSDIERAFKQFERGEYREVVSIAAVGTFAVGWLLPKLAEFKQQHSAIEISLRTNNNIVNLATEGLDFAIRFGEGLWPLTHNKVLFSAPLTVLCSPETAKRLHHPNDLINENLYRSYREDEWEKWCCAANISTFKVSGSIFDSSRLMVETAIYEGGIALAPAKMFSREIASGQLVQPFPIEIEIGKYWLTYLKSKPLTASMEIFQQWLIDEALKECSN